MDQHDDADDYLPPPKKSGVSPMLILGIVLGAGVLVILLVVVCGGFFFFGGVAGPPEPQPIRHDTGVKQGPLTPNPAKDRQPDGMKAKNGPPAGPDK